MGLTEDVAKCLEVVPNMFFRPDFDFTDPGTFEEVMTMSTSGSLQDEVRTARLTSAFSVVCYRIALIQIVCHSR